MGKEHLREADAACVVSCCAKDGVVLTCSVLIAVGSAGQHSVVLSC